MTDLGPLFAYASYRDPETSRSAARTVNAKSLSGKVIAALRERGPMTTRELAEHLGLDLVTISPRMKPLFDKGIVEHSGKLRAGPSGAKSIVWKLTERE